MQNPVIRSRESSVRPSPPGSPARLRPPTGLALLLSGTLCASLIPACVTERPRPAVVVEGRQIFAPRAYLGRWIRETGPAPAGEIANDRYRTGPAYELLFQLPPEPALTVIRGENRTGTASAEAYDIQRIIERPDGRVSFRIVPAGRRGHAGERHFRLEAITGAPAELVEFLDDGRSIRYRRQK